ncbi:MAG: hypothetical protein FJ009_06535 [Chloroflexi bacterium]|nr:hypothetical protein [Chloroflexota bacterium]
MLHESLQAVIGTAVIDSEFRKALLNGSRQRVIQPFNLSREEFDAVMRVRADTLEQFAGQLDQWILETQGKREPPALPVYPTALARGMRQPAHQVIGMGYANNPSLAEGVVPAQATEPPASYRLVIATHHQDQNARPEHTRFANCR